MKKIKIIDLFIKIANGGKTPKKIKHNGKVLNLDNSKELRYRFENDTFLSWGWFIENRLLNDEVEIIEDTEDIKENEEIIQLNTDWYKEVDMNDITNIQIALKCITDRLNEVIDVVNSLNKKEGK